MKSKIQRWTSVALTAAFVIGAPLGLTLGLTGCASSPGTLSKQERIERLLDIAGAAISESDFVSAFETLKQVQSMDDSVPRQYFLYSLAYLNKNEIGLAESNARKALELDPDYSAAKNALGKILLDQGRLSEAEPLLKSAANDILFREAYLSKTNLGLLYFRKMDLKSSELWLQRAIADKGPTTCLALFHLGKVQLEQKNLEKALRNFHMASRGSCGGLSEAHLAVGQTLLKQRKFDLARAKFIEIQRLFPASETSDQAIEAIRGIP
jgi:type IV pilus assembly protein PilF